MTVFAACKDAPEQIPVYLQLEPFTVNEAGGAAWHKITEGWLYVNGEFLGVYPLPGKAPVLADGESQILLFPGVKENGYDDTPNIYDFLTRYETKVNLTPGTTTVIQPTTQYKTDITFPWSLDRSTFDSGSSVVISNRDDDQATGFELTTVGAFAGQSIKMAVDTAHPVIEIVTEQAALPYDGARQIWVELNYRNDMPFTLWLYGTTGTSSEQQIPIYQFANSAQWNKIYFNLTDYVSQAGQEKQRLYFGVKLPTDTAGKYTQLSGTVYLDNIRLVHF
jgi:hypothetical protein